MSHAHTANVVVLSGPAGSGKDAVLHEIIRREPRTTRMVTATTRAQREGEENGVDYIFMKKEEFYSALEKGLIPEHRHIDELDTDYGTYIPELEKELATGKTVIAHMDIIGARYLKERYGALTIFITADSMEVTRQRIMSRQKISEEELATRLEIAEREIKEYGPWYDHTLVNAQGKLAETVDKIISLMRENGFLE